MIPREHEDGMRQKPTLSAAEKADGFAAVMKRLKSHSPEERVRLQTQAEEVVLGHEAYALGQEHLDRGDYEAARRWLRMAAEHRVPGAAQALEEITLHGFTDGAAVAGHQSRASTVSCETIPSPHASRAKDGQLRFPGGVAWAPAVEELYPDQTVASARAWRDADALLAEVRQEAARAAAACADMLLEVERDRKQAAELLAEARQEAETVRSEIAELAEGARRSTDEMLATAQRQAQIVLDDARAEAAQIRGRARRQESAPNRADTQVQWDRVALAASLAMCARSLAGYTIDESFVNTQDGSDGRPAAENSPNVRRWLRRRTAAAIWEAWRAHAAELIGVDAHGVQPWQAARLETAVQAVELLLHVAEADVARMSVGTAHGDLKPSDLLMATGEPRVIDSGFTLLADGSSVLWEENPQEDSQQPSTADAREDLSHAPVPCSNHLWRLERTDRAPSATPGIVWHCGPHMLPGKANTDDVGADEDAELGVKGTGHPAGR
ncbi:ATP synthase F0 subunit B [Streptomyces sp. ATE26]|uniref:ATP synthase F0 subunit B n=1 Tax=Streptomyces sp. ATE26 TaxID=2954237 RepID=UPI002482853B|nr:ATP synthase F0 subunit B [Streptomyces sp. ATE26]MDI1454268.1 ATP synthase F0 subunit B [Streptomyces sp. ATE26]